MSAGQKQKEASTGPKADNVHQLEARRWYVSELYLKGKKQWEIIALVFQKFAVEVSQQTISNDLQWVREQWKKESKMLIDERLALELAKIDQLELEYHALFERSKGKNGKGKGDLKYKQRVEWCMERRAQLLGVDAPKRTELTGLNGAPLKIDDVRERFAGRIASIVQRRGTTKNTKSDKRR